MCLHTYQEKNFSWGLGGSNSFFPLACPSHTSGFQGFTQTSGPEADEGLEHEQAAEAQKRQIASDSGTEQPERAVGLAW